MQVTNNSAIAKIALQGAHLFHYQRNGDLPLLYVSGSSHFEKGQAIRGGIPICWPWFGKHKTNPILPQHGFVRTALWRCAETREDESTTVLCFEPENICQGHEYWPFQTALRLEITVGDKLSLRLITTNRDTTPFTISEALHSYFAVSDITDTTIHGLGGISFLDTLTMKQECEIKDITISCETDRVYQHVSQDITIIDKHRTITIQSGGSKSTVLWNPWIEKSRRMADMDNDGYKKMLCLETANALADERTLMPDETHILSATIF
ncbi:MAG: D-hexose-6-phosphate mutarotase [Desulfocapsa sp.]|nr:MAG: D-hexose-6-phosphate mutarotase [Desulfocapsa sp.]